MDTLYIGYIIHLRDNDMRKLNPNKILFGVKQRNFNPANISDSTVVHRIGKEVSSVYMEIRHDMLTVWIIKHSKCNCKSTKSFIICLLNLFYTMYL